MMTETIQFCLYMKTLKYLLYFYIDFCILVVQMRLIVILIIFNSIFNICIQ